MEKERMGKSMAGVILGITSGFLFAAVAVALLQKPFGFYLWPLIAGVDFFTFATMGFFLTKGKKELLYGVCSLLAADCVVVQLAIIF